jgi:peptidoglycan/LPS O-acetylase OafA/YrhL
MEPPKRVLSVEGLRGVASLCVAWFHLTSQYHWGFVRASGSWGWLGVEAFFVISGFVIPYSLWMTGYKLKNFTRYMARRTLRIEPPYVISILLTLALWELSALAPGFAGSTVEFSAPQILFHFFYLIPLTHYTWISPVYWSLAYEFVFYIAIGLLYGFLFSRHIAWSLTLAFGIFACSGDAMVFLFVIGIASMRYKVGIDRVSVAAAFSFMAAAPLAYSAGLPFAVVGLATAAIIAFINLDRLAWPLAFLGKISYSLYLTHVPIGGRVVNLGMRFGNSELYTLILSLAALSVSVSFAWLFYFLVERRATQIAAAVSYRSSRGPSSQKAS